MNYESNAPWGNAILSAINEDIFFRVLYVFLIFLYFFVGFNSYGYDDEFTNINLIEKFGIHTISITQHVDVHPPGSYFFDWLIYKVCGSWNITRAVIGIITAMSLMYAISSVKKSGGAVSAIICFILLGLNPALLMWCTSLRWYAFFVPILIWLLFPPKKNTWYYWGKCFGGLLILGYFGYAFFIIFPAVLLIYWGAIKENFEKKIKCVILFGLCFFILYAYQLLVFLNVHLPNRDSQVSSLTQSIAGVFISQLSNQGVFPVSIPGIIGAIGSIGLSIMLIFSSYKNRKPGQYMAPYLVGLTAYIITGLAGKFRNLVCLSPIQALWFSTSERHTLNKKILILLVIFILIGNMSGIYNVVNHLGTVKNSWNLPVGQILDNLDEAKKECRGDILVLSHDKTLTWHIKQRGISHIGPFDESSLPISDLHTAYNCVVLLKTYPGIIGNKKYAEMNNAINSLKFDYSTTKSFGEDPFYSLKKKIDERYPKYSIQMITYFNASNLSSLEKWEWSLN